MQSTELSSLWITGETPNSSMLSLTINPKEYNKTNDGISVDRIHDELSFYGIVYLQFASSSTIIKRREFFLEHGKKKKNRIIIS
jgi:hypothetical protein